MGVSSDFDPSAQGSAVREEESRAGTHSACVLSTEVAQAKQLASEVVFIWLKKARFLTGVGAQRADKGGRMEGIIRAAMGEGSLGMPCCSVALSCGLVELWMQAEATGRWLGSEWHENYFP